LPEAKVIFAWKDSWAVQDKESVGVEHMLRVSDVVWEVERIAPPRLAHSGDPIGLQVGRSDAQVAKILVSVDPSRNVVEKAAGGQGTMLVSPHPLIYSPLASLGDDGPVARRVVKLIQAGAAFFAAHTNFDAAPGGTNDSLADALGLVGCEVLGGVGEGLCKIVAFVPEESLQKVMEAMLDAGAGHIGPYSHCSFRIPGTGTFLPMDGANPRIGSVGKLETVPEIRLEMVCEKHLKEDVVAAMLAAHPYEMPAYDVYELANAGPATGLGRIGSLPEPVSLSAFADCVRSRLGLSTMRVRGEADRIISRVALVAGGGSSMFRDAARARADVFITGDTRHSDLVDAEVLGLATIDAGHFETEKPGVLKLTEKLKSALASSGTDVEYVE
jgi:dinuclear metal center YbgI/SA1388 family protein